MPSLSDRKEIAKRLRLCALDASCCADIGAYLPHWVGIGCVKDDDDSQSIVPAKEKTASSTLKKLAALIDPTCHDFGGEEGTNGEGYDFACSACGWCGDVAEPNYCPYCGARVVSEDA